MDLGLTSKTIIITGGAKALGPPRSDPLPPKAPTSSSPPQPAEGIALAQETNSLFIEAELSEESACHRVVEKSLAAHGRIDVLVNNAGYNDGKNLETAPEEFMASVHLNLSHVYTLTHLCREELIRNQGAIINVSSKVATTARAKPPDTPPLRVP